MLEINKSAYKDPIIYNLNKRLIIDKILQDSNTLFIYQSKIDLSPYNDIKVYIKNIKTRHKYECINRINKNIIELDLEHLCSLFTDYEAAIEIEAAMNNKLYIFNPIIVYRDTVNNIKNHQCINSTYRWYIRVLNNGELRLSCIKNIYTEKEITQ